MSNPTARAHTDDNGQTEGKGNKPANQLKPIFRGAIHDFSSFGVLGNLIIGVPLLLVGPLVAILTGNLKSAIIAAAIGVTLLLWIGVIFVIRNLPSRNHSETTASEPNPAPPSEESSKPTLGTPSNQSQASVPVPNPPLQFKSNDKAKGLDMSKKDKTRTPSIDNRITNSPIVNSPNSVQAPGGTVTVNQLPPPRHITTEQRARFLDLVKGQPKGEINITCHLGTTEPCTFAREIQRLLLDAGWNVTKLSEMLYVGNPTGLTLLVESQQTTPDHGVALQRAFAAIGIEAQGSVMEGKQPYTVTLLVGVKP